MEILILHGWGQNKTFWEQNVKQIKHIAPTSAIDLPGFGKEPLVDRNWGIPEYAQWVEDYVKKNKMKNIVLIGHSFGGRIAGYLASKKPQWLKYLVLEGAPLIYRPTRETILRVRFYKLVRNLLPSSVKKLFYPQELQNAYNRNLGNIFRNVVNFDQTKNIQKISVSTLVIWGENDREVPLSIAQEIHQLIPNSQLEIVANAGHMAHKDNPNLFYGIVKKFIQSH